MSTISSEEPKSFNISSYSQKKKTMILLKCYVVDIHEKSNFHKAIHKRRLMLTCPLPPKAQWSTRVTYAIYIC